MNTLHTVIFSTLCITATGSCIAAHEPNMQYDLAQRQTTQKFIKNVRNISATLVLAGIIRHMLGKEFYHPEHPCLCCPENLITIFPFSFALTGIYLKQSLLTLITSALYGIYNGMQIETLQQEIAKLEHIA